jgi:hypothetical protein
VREYLFQTFEDDIEVNVDEIHQLLGDCCYDRGMSTESQEEQRKNGGMSGRDLAAELLQNQDQERATRQLKVIHNPNTDIILNNDSNDAIWGQKLADAWREGMPDGWKRPPNTFKNNVYYGSVNGQTFLAKYRLNTAQSTNDVEAIQGISQDHVLDKRTKLSLNSLVSEVRMSPVIKQVVASADMQELAEQCGLSGIEYIEPIIGVVDRTSGDPGFARKAMVYRYIEDAGPFSGEDLQGANRLIHALRSKLKGLDIEPTDLTLNQVIVDQEQHAYLLDSEAYSESGEST